MHLSNLQVRERVRQIDCVMVKGSDEPMVLLKLPVTALAKQAIAL